MELAQTLLNGILLGGLYGVIGLGLSLIFGIMRVVNLAHGDLIVLASYLCLTLLAGMLGSPFLTLIAVMPAMFILGFALQRFVINYTLGQGLMPPLLVTFGISIILQNLLLLIYKPDARTLPTSLAAESIRVSEKFAVPTIYTLDLFAAIFIFGLIGLLLGRTRLGRAFRATSDDAEAAVLMGVNPRWIYGLATGLSAALAATAGVLLGTTFTFYPSTGSGSLITAFETVVIGGLGSLWGTLAGGILLGVAQLLGAQLLGPSYGLIAGHVIFLAVLLLRPQGLFPRVGL